MKNYFVPVANFVQKCQTTNFIHVFLNTFQTLQPTYLYLAFWWLFRVNLVVAFGFCPKTLPCGRIWSTFAWTEKFNNGLCTQFLPSATKLRKGNVFTSLCHSVHRERHAWQRGEGMNGRGAVCGRGHAWQGACVIGEMATTADGTHPTGNYKNDIQ